MKVILELEIEIDGHYSIEDVEDYYAFKSMVLQNICKRQCFG